MSFGNRLRQLRLEYNMTQEQLSNILNVSRATVGRYETNERFPDKDILKKIADFFNVSIDFLLEQTNEKNVYVNAKKNLYKDSSKYIAYKEIEHEIAKKLIEENIIKEGYPITKNILELIISYGLDAAVEILKARKKQDE